MMKAMFNKQKPQSNHDYSPVPGNVASQQADMPPVNTQLTGSVTGRMSLPVRSSDEGLEPGVALGSYRSLSMQRAKVKA